MSAELNETAVVERAASAAFREFDGKVFLARVESAKIAILNETGTALWSYLVVPRSLGELAERLAEEFEVERPAALEGCAEFVRSMLERGLLSLVNA
jgi:hypothetical protein